RRRGTTATSAAAASSAARYSWASSRSTASLQLVTSCLGVRPAIPLSAWSPPQAYSTNMQVLRSKYAIDGVREAGRGAFVVLYRWSVLRHCPFTPTRPLRGCFLLSARCPLDSWRHATSRYPSTAGVVACICIIIHVSHIVRANRRGPGWHPNTQNGRREWG